MRISVSACVICGALAVSGCGGSGGGTSSTQSTSPVTSKQAAAIGRVLYNDFRTTGATYRAVVPGLGSNGVVLEGQIDFRVGDGVARVRVIRPDTSLSPGRRIYWTRTTVLEGDIPGLTAAMAKRGRNGVEWVSRPVNKASKSFDPVLRFLNALAAKRPENPILIQQAGAQYVRADVVDGTTVDVYRYGQLTMFIDAKGMLRRVDAPIEGTSQVSSITLSNHGPQRIELPPAS